LSLGSRFARAYHLAWRLLPATSCRVHLQTIAKEEAVPRHTEVNYYLARKICRDLEIPLPL
jgi:hypothetical protein